MNKNVDENNKDYIYAIVICRLVEDILNQFSNLFINPKKFILEYFVKAIQKTTI